MCLYVFEGFLISKALFSKYSHTQLTKWCYTYFSFKIYKKNGKKKKRRWSNHEEKKKENSVTIMRAVDGKRNSVLYEIKIRRWIIRKFQKRCCRFDWNKSPENIAYEHCILSKSSLKSSKVIWILKASICFINIVVDVSSVVMLF